MHRQGVMRSLPLVCRGGKTLYALSRDIAADASIGRWGQLLRELAVATLRAAVAPICCCVRRSGWPCTMKVLWTVTLRSPPICGLGSTWPRREPVSSHCLLPSS